MQKLVPERMGCWFLEECVRLQGFRLKKQLGAVSRTWWATLGGSWATAVLTVTHLPPVIKALLSPESFHGWEHKSAVPLLNLCDVTQTLRCARRLSVQWDSGVLRKGRLVGSTKDAGFVGELNILMCKCTLGISVYLYLIVLCYAVGMTAWEQQPENIMYFSRLLSTQL